MFACGGRAVLDNDDAANASDGAGASGTAGTSSAAGATSTTGGATSNTCRVSADCPQLSGICAENVCSSGKCERVASPEGSSKHPHQPADCLDDVCDGTGGIKSVPDTANIPSSTNPCAALYCDVTGISYFRALPLRTSCGLNSSPRFCDGFGNCVSCTSSEDCDPSELCSQAHECVPE
jgi:hypothetical protein